ncbi:MAG: hypothetical protein KKD31_12660, partial [Bacteroidetes bacterium]|nr:hypothetical protein [Bacteroidota bacterium]
LAQKDSACFIGKIQTIEIKSGVDRMNKFMVTPTVFSRIYGTPDSTFFLHSPSKQMLVTDFENPETFNDQVFLFYVKKEANYSILVQVHRPDSEFGKCEKCNKTLQGFSFGNDSFMHYLSFCPEHGLMNEEWDDY